MQYYGAKMEQIIKNVNHHQETFVWLENLKQNLLHASICLFYGYGS